MKEDEVKIPVTLGKWQVNLLAKPPNIYAISPDGRSRPICKMIWEEDAQTSLANARLITNSKELYQALHGLIHALVKLDTGKKGTLAKWIVAGLTVLSKVEGRITTE